MLPYYFQIPLGVILAIVDPVVIAVSKSGPTVIAGKSIVLKPPTQVFISLIRKVLSNCFCMHHLYSCRTV